MPEFRRDTPAVVREYTGLAQTYDRRWSAYIDATVRETHARLPLQAGDRILDIGCGTGAVLAALAQEPVPLHLAGIDPVPAMLAMARQRLPAQVELKESRAESLPFADASFDSVVSCSVLHYIRAPDRALAEISRVLVPGGNLVITDWCADYLNMWMYDRYLALVNAAHCHTFRTQELENLLDKGGFVNIRTARYRSNGFWGLMTAVAEKPTADEATGMKGADTGSKS